MPRATVTRHGLPILASLALAALLAGPARSCTTVCLLGADRAVVAYNYDFEPSEGLIVVNKRGARRTALLRRQPATWTASYGSVTFNQFGRDQPTTGINEKGLMVSLMWLDETAYPAPDERPAVGVLEWIQYHLDRHATVAEVVANAGAVRPTGRVPIHYLFADAGGDAAAIEFLDGRLVVHRGGGLPVRALANSTYADSVAAFAAAGGVVPSSASSLDRFVRAASLAGGGGPDPIARGFAVLESVAQPRFTRWSIVYDLGARVVHFRTDGNPAIRRLALSDFDFSCRTPVKILDVTAGAGDVAPAFTEYSRAANRALIEATFSKVPFLKDVPASARDVAAAHPETAACAAAD